ncbi:MAG: TetR/AcrR family transcriptional regulator [Marinobacter sp.]|uniref:TetR/AcrR family transcriptional regulator n=1 Tax=Marinobacter sp. TaxID=50741 RepID=UPI00299DB1AE|nr:TetR/AcrR family transcriptional regulator [Marinobacter sp.]MDX1635722.1 TetR/AcrR family transcriptional regulator [Marinobacter sp.]
MQGVESQGKRERNRIQNRRAILLSALECFRELGYEQTTIRDIVRRTDLAAGTFYNYFSNKADIFSALLTDYLDGLNRNLTKARHAAGTDEDFIHSAYLALFRATADDPTVYELAYRNDQTIRQLFGADILGLARLSLEHDVADAVKRGVLPPVDQEYLCAAFFGVAYELSLRLARRATESPDSAPELAGEAAEFATRLFLGGLRELAWRSR